MPTSSKVVFELDGPDVSPETADTVTLLGLASDYFLLVSKVAAFTKTELRITGLEVVDKCVAVRADASPKGSAKYVTDYAGKVLSDINPPPPGCADLAKSIRGRVGALPDKFSAQAIFESRSHRIPPPAKPADRERESTSLRANLVRIGGSSSPAARFKSLSEKREFNLSVTKAQALELGKHLYDDMDLEFAAWRNPGGWIEGGELTSVHYLGKGSGLEKWRTWFGENCSEWDSVDDIEGQLGRGSN